MPPNSVLHETHGWYVLWLTDDFGSTPPTRVRWITAPPVEAFGPAVSVDDDGIVAKLLKEKGPLGC